MASSASILAYEMRDALYAAFSAEMHAGGKLANLVSLRKSNQLAQNALVNPSDVAGGIKMHGHADPKPLGRGLGSSRAFEVEQKFEIILAARSKRTTGKIALLDDALEVLRPVIDDGHGGGVVGVLNSPSTFALPNGAGGFNAGLGSRLGPGMFYEDIQNEGADQSVWALYSVEYFATGQFSF